MRNKTNMSLVKSAYDFDTMVLVSPGEEEQRRRESLYYPKIQGISGTEAVVIHIKCHDKAYDGNQVKHNMSCQKVAALRRAAILVGFDSLGVRHQGCRTIGYGGC